MFKLNNKKYTVTILLAISITFIFVIMFQEYYYVRVAWGATVCWVNAYILPDITIRFFTKQRQLPNFHINLILLILVNIFTLVSQISAIAILIGISIAIAIYFAMFVGTINFKKLFIGKNDKK